MDENIKKLIEESVKKEVEMRVSAHCNNILSQNIIEKEIKKVVTPTFLEGKIEQEILKWIKCSVEELITEDRLLSVVKSSNKEYQTMLKDLMTKLLKEKDIQELLKEYIRDNYLYNLNEICAVEDMVNKFFKDYTFVLAPKPKRKKR